MRNVLKVVGALLVMAACGVAAFVATITFFMNLGLKRHGNYEYYGSWPVAGLIYLAGAIGFLAPGMVMWRLRARPIPSQFSLRSVLIAMTLVAVLAGLIAIST